MDLLAARMASDSDLYMYACMRGCVCMHVRMASELDLGIGVCMHCVGEGVGEGLRD